MFISRGSLKTPKAGAIPIINNKNDDIDKATVFTVRCAIMSVIMSTPTPRDTASAQPAYYSTTTTPTTERKNEGGVRAKPGVGYVESGFPLD